VAEAEVLTDVHLDGSQRVQEHPPQELVGLLAGEFDGEREHQDAVHAEGPQQLDASARR
jgi:hypothetical protein